LDIGNKKMIFNPIVSIIIPVYNGSNYMREAIDSALQQTYRNREVIVVNDGSKDDGKTENIAKSYGNLIRYFHKENGGVASALNFGIDKMEGEYVSWLSHDDVYYPYKLEKQIAFLQQNKKDIILYSDYDFIDHESRYLRTNTIEHAEPDQFVLAMLTGHPIHGCTTLFHKNCIHKTGRFNEKLKATQDYDLWFRMAKNYDFVHMKEVLIQSRLHPDQGTNTMSAVMMKEVYSVYKNFLDDINTNSIFLNPGTPKSSFFLIVAEKLRQVGFIHVADYAFRLSTQNTALKETISDFNLLLRRMRYRKTQIISFIKNGIFHIRQGLKR